MESGSELEKERFITLLPEDRLRLTGDGFECPDVKIPDIGIVSLSGSNDFEYDDEELGITIIEDRIVVKKANDLEQMGLFDTFVDARSPFSLDNPVICKMAMSKCGLDLETKMLINVADRLEEVDTETIYSGGSNIWKLRGDERNLHFFAPADPKLLSQLQFSFRQSLNLPKNQ